MIVHFPATFEPGINHLLKAKHHPQANIDLSLLVLQKGESYTSDIEKEVVAVLLSGHILAEVEVLSEELVRSDVFYGEPQVVHVPKSTAFTLTGRAARSEIMLVATCNPKRFKPAILHPLDMLSPKEIRGVGLMNDSAVRTAYTFFDRSNCPATNFFIGEIVMPPGKWSSFPPHFHRETEFYFYKFLPENGYGYAEVNGGVQIVRQHSLTVMCESEPHPQVTTPAYAEWYLWCTRLNDEQPLHTTFLPEHEWVNHPSAKLYPHLSVKDSD